VFIVGSMAAASLVMYFAACCRARAQRFWAMVRAVAGVILCISLPGIGAIRCPLGARYCSIATSPGPARCASVSSCMATLYTNPAQCSTSEYSPSMCDAVLPLV
jgi:hypothetical protein